MSVGRTLRTTVRIAHAEPRPGDLGNGIFITHGYLVVLADDTVTGPCRSGSPDTPAARRCRNSSARPPTTS
jgi:hypothetical protein